MTDETPWHALYRVGAAAAIAMLVLIPVQTAVYFLAASPTTTAGYFALFQRSTLLGLLRLDLLYMLDIVLAGLLLTVVCVALRRESPSFVVIAAFLNLAGMCIYFSSNPAFEMAILSDRYAAASTDAERLAALGAGEAMLASYEGSAYNVSSAFTRLSGLTLALVMLRSRTFGKVTAVIGIAVNVLALVPPGVGTVGVVASVLLLAPFIVWMALVARTLVALSRRHVIWEASGRRT